jgi:hypothetical protein
VLVALAEVSTRWLTVVPASAYHLANWVVDQLESQGEISSFLFAGNSLYDAGLCGSMALQKKANKGRIGPPGGGRVWFLGLFID